MEIAEVGVPMQGEEVEGLVMVASTPPPPTSRGEMQLGREHPVTQPWIILAYFFVEEQYTISSPSKLL